jgi:hypothetical protein
MIFLKKTTRNRLTAYCFLLPNLLGFLVFTLLPVFTALGLSFMRWDSYSPIKYVGLRNFATMFRDSSFIIAFWNTLYFTGLTVPLTVIFALLLALALNKGFRSIKIIRAIHFFPHVASLIAVAVVWQFFTRDWDRHPPAVDGIGNLGNAGGDYHDGLEISRLLYDDVSCRVTSHTRSFIRSGHDRWGLAMAKISLCYSATAHSNLVFCPDHESDLLF